MVASWGIVSSSQRDYCLVEVAHVDRRAKGRLFFHQRPVAVVGKGRRLAGFGVGDPGQPVLHIPTLLVGHPIPQPPGHVAILVVAGGVRFRPHHEAQGPVPIDVLLAGEHAYAVNGDQVTLEVQNVLVMAQPAGAFFA
jgi:hypothetical protein